MKNKYFSPLSPTHKKILLVVKVLMATASVALLGETDIILVKIGGYLAVAAGVLVEIVDIFFGIDLNEEYEKSKNKKDQDNQDIVDELKQSPK